LYIEENTGCQQNTKEMAPGTWLARVGGACGVGPAYRQERALATRLAGSGVV